VLADLAELDVANHTHRTAHTTSTTKSFTMPGIFVALLLTLQLQVEPPACWATYVCFFVRCFNGALGHRDTGARLSVSTVFHINPPACLLVEIHSRLKAPLHVEHLSL
jgi:hypothetical protein